MDTTRVITEQDVIDAVADAIIWNEGDYATCNILIHVGAEIVGVDEEEFCDMLGYTSYGE